MYWGNSFDEKINGIINPLASPGEAVSAFTYPYLSAGAPAPGEVKGLITIHLLFCLYIDN